MDLRILRLLSISWAWTPTGCPALPSSHGRNGKAIGMRKANAIREQFIYCNKSMRRRGPGYGEPAPKKLKDQPRPLDYKLYELWKDGEKAQRHPRVTDPPTHPPVAGAQLEAAWGGQQRHGLQSNPAGGMEPEAWQKLKQLRCKRSCNTVAAWMQMHWSQKEPGVSLQQLRDEWSRVSKAALSIRWVLGAQTRTPQCDPIGRSSVCIRQVISAGAPVSVNYGDVDASMPRNEAWRIRFLEQINYKATGGRKPTGEVKLSKYLIESLLSFNTQCTYTLTCASSQQFCLDLSTMYHPLHETFLRFCILVGILNYSCPFRQWPRIPCDVAFAAQLNILVLDSATEKYLH